MTTQITTAKDVLISLGGTVKVRKLLGVTAQAVSWFRTNEAIPARHFPKIQSALSRIGKQADMSVFNFDTYKRDPKKIHASKGVPKKKPAKKTPTRRRSA